MSIIPGRVKEKWSADPQNTTWARDTNRFGYKMLEQMGWSEGAGLGADGKGIKSHVKVNRKRDALGVGCKNDYDYEWLKTQDSYNSLLADLSTHNTDENETAAGGDKALPSGGRRSAMVYNRFRKSKDLNMYSKDDLSAILGKDDKRPQRFKDDAEVPVQQIGEARPDDLMKTSSVNLSDYFAQRSQTIRASASGSADDSASEDERPTMGSSTLMARFMGLTNGAPHVDEETESKPKRKKKNHEDAVISDDETQKKKKKKAAAHDVDDDTAPAAGEDAPPKQKKNKMSKSEEPEEVDEPVIKKKSKKNKH